MKQKIVHFSTYLLIFNFVVLTESCFRNNVYLIMFLLCESNISIILIGCDYDGFKFFCSCLTFYKNVFVFFLYFSRLSSVLLIVSVLVISWWKYNPFSAFTFISFVVTISGFTSASASWVIASMVSCFLPFFQTKHHQFFHSCFHLC